LQGGELVTINRILWVFAFLVLLFPLAPTTLAAPLPPIRVVDHQTQECSEIPFGGDECMDCFPQEGWEVLGVAYDVPCPAGYAVVESVDYDCQPFKNQFCCSEGHSGVPGDCQDLVVNGRAKQCAFVDDIADCELPRRWSKRPDTVDLRDWVCPANYEWLETLECSSESSSPSATLPCLGVTALGPVVLGLWLVSRGKG
jgi:hypothetical protein